MYLVYSCTDLPSWILMMTSVRSCFTGTTLTGVAAAQVVEWTSVGCWNVLEHHAEGLKSGPGGHQEDTTCLDIPEYWNTTWTHRQDHDRQDLLVRHDEVEKGPELLQRVLQGRSCDEQPVVGLELHHGLVEERIIILQSVCLIHTDEGPVHIAQEWLHTHTHTFRPNNSKPYLSEMILALTEMLTLSLRRISYVVRRMLNFILLLWTWIHSWVRI